MRNTRKVMVLVLASASVVFAIGLPWLLKKHRTPAEYVANEVATTAEIQEFDLMWTNLESLQEKAADLGPEQYEQQFLELTIAYLQLDLEQTKKFVNVVDQSLERLGAAKDRLALTSKQTQKQASDAGDSRRGGWSGENPDSIAARRGVALGANGLMSKGKLPIFSSASCSQVRVTMFLRSDGCSGF